MTVTAGLTALKVCGATSPHDVELLAEAGADFVGLWYGIPSGHNELSSTQLNRLARTAHDTRQISPMLVTFSSDVNLLTEAVSRTGIRWLQLHAYQPPAVVRALRSRLGGDVRIVKVIHMRGGICLERSLLRSYERAGTDIFLLDKVTEDGRIGSTGQQLTGTEVAGVVSQFSRPFFLAGGISAVNRPEYEEIIYHPQFFGIDVDTAARDSSGRFDAANVYELSLHWATPGRLWT